MVYNPDKDWVSEEGTMHVMSLAREPHSINETNEAKARVMDALSHKEEPPLSPQAGTDPDEAPSKEPSESADQKDAAKKASLGKVKSMAMGSNVLFYAALALGALFLLSEVA